jgi:mevalonate kinase
VELIKIRIPGKVMLSGEYAVLYGGASVLMPIPRYLEVAEVEESPTEPYSKMIDAALQVDIPSIADYEIERGKPKLRVNSYDFFNKTDNGKLAKFGLGCSAAEAVAVVALRYERAGRPFADNRQNVFQDALRIHQEVQENLGSGADVAACAYGRPLRYRLHNYESIIEPIEVIKPAIPLCLVWTGQAADTRSLVKRFRRWADDADRAVRNDLASLIQVSNKLADSWFKPEAGKLFGLMDEYDEIIAGCAEKAGIQYKLKVHQKIRHGAKQNGGRAKPTGAGGGDMILLAGRLPVEELDGLVIPI